MLNVVNEYAFSVYNNALNKVMCNLVNVQYFMK